MSYAPACRSRWGYHRSPGGLIYIQDAYTPGSFTTRTYSHNGAQNAEEIRPPNTRRNSEADWRNGRERMLALARNAEPRRLRSMGATPSASRRMAASTRPYPCWSHPPPHLREPDLREPRTPGTDDAQQASR